MATPRKRTTGRTRPRTGASRKKDSPRAFSAAVEVDAATGWRILVLRHRARPGGPGVPRRPAGARGPTWDMEARIAPEAGGNLFSLAAGGEQLLVPPVPLAELRRHHAGTPIMFPTPNRVRDATFTFAGRRFPFPPNSGTHFIHGLVRHLAWRAAPPVAGPAHAAATVSIDWTPAQPDFALYPFAHRLTVTFTLRATGIRIAYAVHNRGRQMLPFGFGLHPWFRVPGNRARVFLQVPVSRLMESVAHLPTGKLIEVRGTRFDLRRPVSLAALDLDDVYFGVRPSSRPRFLLRDRGIAVTVRASRDFAHLVVYTPPGQACFCIESQTSATDAHNLHARGLGKVANLILLRPGATRRGHVEWRIERLPPEVEARPLLP